jgi:PKD repeat protein
VARYDGPGNSQDWPSGIVLDSSGNIYVTGMSGGNGTGADYATIKYDSSGNEQWVARYNGSGNDTDNPRDLTVDSSGNIYVTGTSKNADGNSDYATIKYDSNGNQSWVARYNHSASSNDGAWAITVNSSGNIYVTGHSSGDYATIAYDSFGNELWVARYNGPANMGDGAEFMTLDSSGNVYVIGRSEGIGTDNDYATIKYDPQGNELWVARYNGPENEFDYPKGIVTDSLGNVYVTGRENLDTNPNYATIAYNSSGDELWVARYDGPGNGNDHARDLTIDSFGNIYVTGDSVGSGTSADFATVAYDSNGTELWVMRYNGPGNGFDGGWAIATDSSGNVYVTGHDAGSGTGSDFCTIKYSQAFPNQLPVADVGPDQTVDEGDVVELNGSASYDTNGTIEAYEWDFDSDGIYDYQETPSNASDGAFDGKTTHIYGDDGVYLVTLRVTDDAGANGTNTCNITVLNVAPTIDSIIAPSGNEGSSITFTANASDPASDDLTFTWNWGDGTSDTVTIYYNNGVSSDPYPSPDINPMDITDTVNHTYNDDGIYLVTIFVEDDDAGASNDSFTVQVNDLASIVEFTWSPQPQFEGSPVQFTDLSTSYPDVIVGWEWDFGGLGSSTDQNPEFTFMDNGSFTVILTVKDDDNSTDSVSHDVTILDLAPIAEFTWSPELQDEGSPVQFTDLSAFTIDNIVAWEWDFAGLGSSTDQNPEFIFMDNGTYSVTLTVTDDDNSTSSVSHDVTVLDLAPVANFTWSPEPQDEGLPVQFTDLSTSYPDIIVSWAWDFDDGGTSTLQNPSHTYGDNDVYMVTLTVTDDDSSTDSITYAVTILNVAPIVDAGEDQITDEGTTISFLGNFSDPGWLDTHTIEWDFGDGSTATGTLTPIYAYRDNGVYTVNLTIMDDDGGSVVSNTTVTVHDIPPTIEAREPGGTTGQSYIQGHMITVTWTTYDYDPLPLNPINIAYGNVSIGWITITTNEADDGVYLWDTSVVPCGTYLVNISVYDSIGQTTFDEGNYSFVINYPGTYPPEIKDVKGEPDPQTVGEEVTISALVTDRDTALDDLTVKVNITKPDRTSLGNFTMTFNPEIDKFTYTSDFDLEGIYTFVIWASDPEGNWAKGEGTFVMELEPEPEVYNWKPIIALTFTVILLILGALISYKRPVRFKRIMQKDRLYTFFSGVLPFVVAEAITGVISLFTGILSVPPILGIGMIVDLGILIVGLICYLVILKRGSSAIP